MKAHARLIRPMPGQDPPIKLQNLLLEGKQLSTERAKAAAGNLRHSLVIWVSNNAQQFRDPFTPDRRHNPELGEVRSNRVNDSGLLTDEQMTGVLVGTNRMLARVTASQMASASAMSFFCRLT
jgi:hypothetical protein